MRAATSTTESRRTEDRAQEHGGYIPNVRAIPHQTKQKTKQKRKQKRKEEEAKASRQNSTKLSALRTVEIRAKQVTQCVCVCDQ